MQDNTALDYFQEKLVDLLLKNLSPEEVVAQLKSDTFIEPFFSYIDTFDLTMLSVSSEIVKKWATESSNHKTNSVNL